MNDTTTIPPFDTLAFSKRLEAAGVSPEHAVAHTEALAIVLSNLVTKHDLNTALKDLEWSLSLRLGGFIVILHGLLFAALRIWH